MSLRTRAFLYQLACFAVLFVIFRFLIDKFTNLQGFWIPFTAFVIGTLISPKFQVVRTKDGDKMFMKWLFVKGIREVK